MSEPPFFSVCIPQYNRTSFLLEALRSMSEQTFRDVELCVSDDRSTDGREAEVRDVLQASGLRHAYARTPANLGYDANLRSAIALSSGRYLFLMGNDDALADPGVLERLHAPLQRVRPAAAICNYVDAPSGRVFRRMTATAVLGAGPEVAAAAFRRYSFVSGVILDGPGARAGATGAHDGSEMYQMYLGTRLVAAGGSLLGVDEVCVRKDIQVPGEAVDSYRTRRETPVAGLTPRVLPMSRLFEVVRGALEGVEPARRGHSAALSALLQLYAFIYPYWLLEHRRTKGWRFALQAHLGVRPRRVLGGYRPGVLALAAIRAEYLLLGAIGLLLPLPAFAQLERPLYALAKRIRRRG